MTVSAANIMGSPYNFKSKGQAVLPPELLARRSDLANISSAKKSRISDVVDDDGPIRLRAT